MKKHIWIFQCFCIATIFFLMSCALMPACNAQIITPQTHRENASQDSSVKKIRYLNNDDEYFFDFAIIWGTFEEKIDYMPLFSLAVRNRAPWYNLTMYVIGYWIPEHQWFFKKSYQVECWYLHIGIVGRHWLFVIGYGNIAAF